MLASTPQSRNTRESPGPNLLLIEEVPLLNPLVPRPIKPVPKSHKALEKQAPEPIVQHQKTNKYTPSNFSSIWWFVLFHSKHAAPVEATTPILTPSRFVRASHKSKQFRNIQTNTIQIQFCIPTRSVQFVFWGGRNCTASLHFHCSSLFFLHQGIQT